MRGKITMAQYDIISFLSDLGTSDESVGVCKAIIMQQAPNARVIDVTHEIAPFDIRAGALALTRAIQFLPTGIVLAAIDPGAPKDQRYIAVELENSIFIGPDNGILAPAAQLLGDPIRVHELTNPEYRIEAPGGVFAARDIMAPAAGVIASGIDMSELGNEIPLEQLVPGMLQLSRHDEGGAFLGEVWSIDRFSNIQTNITPEELTSSGLRIGDTALVRVGQNDFMVKFVERYADLAKSQLGLIIDSTGMLSVVKNLDFAAKELGVSESDAIAILPQGTTITGRDITVESVNANPTPVLEDVPVAPQSPAPVAPQSPAPVAPPVAPQSPAPIQPLPVAQSPAPLPEQIIPSEPQVKNEQIKPQPQTEQAFFQEPKLAPQPENPISGQVKPMTVPQEPLYKAHQEPSPTQVIQNPAFKQFETLEPHISQEQSTARIDPKAEVPIVPQEQYKQFDHLDNQNNSGSVSPNPAVFHNENSASIPSVAQPVTPYVVTQEPVIHPEETFQQQADEAQSKAPEPSQPVDQIPSGNVFDLFKIDDDTAAQDNSEDPFSPAHQ